MSASSILSRINGIRIFSLLVLTIMSVRYLVAFEYDILKLLQGLFVHKLVLTSLAVYSIPYVMSRSQDNKSNKDAKVVEWYWWNAWLYHTVMDGLSGSFHLVPVVVQQYFILDKRFQTHHVVPWTIGAIELFVMAPLCFVTMHCILTHSSLRYPMEIITSTFQLVGMIVFVGAEVYEGQLNVPALDPVGVPGNPWANVKFLDLYHITYYWFGFWFCNLVWGFVPIYRIVVASKECQKAIEMSSSRTGSAVTNGASSSRSSNGKKVS